MEREQLLYAIGDIDDRFLQEAETYAPARHPARGYWIAAACLALVCVGAALLARQAPKSPQEAAAVPETESEACYAVPEDAMLTELQHAGPQQVAAVEPRAILPPVGGKEAVYALDYTCITPEAQVVLRKYRGEIYNESAGRQWYRINGTEALKYLICEAEGETQLWRFFRFDGDFTLGEVYTTIYGMSAPEDLTAITVNDGTIWGEETVQRFYTITADVVLHDSDTVFEHLIPVYLFNTSLSQIENLAYDPESRVLLLGGAASDPLPEETAREISAILGITG